MTCHFRPAPGCWSAPAIERLPYGPPLECGCLGPDHHSDTCELLGALYTYDFPAPLWDRPRARCPHGGDARTCPDARRTAYVPRGVPNPTASTNHPRIAPRRTERRTA